MKILFFIVFCKARNSCKQTVDPDQTPHLVASELGGPHCLHTHCDLKRALTLYKGFYPLTGSNPIKS